MTHNLFGLVAYKEGHNVVNLIKAVEKELEGQSGKEHMKWEKTWNGIAKMSEVEGEDEEDK